MEVRYVVIAILSVISCVVYLGLVFSDEQKVYEGRAWRLYAKLMVCKTFELYALEMAVRSILTEIHSLDEKKISFSIICVILLIVNLIFKFSSCRFWREYEVTCLIINSVVPILALMKAFCVEDELVSVSKIMWILLLGALMIGGMVFAFFSFQRIREWLRDRVDDIAGLYTFPIIVWLFLDVCYCFYQAIKIWMT